MCGSVLEISNGRSAVPIPLASYDRLMSCYRATEEVKADMVLVMGVIHGEMRKIISLPKPSRGLSRMTSKSARGS